MLIGLNAVQKQFALIWPTEENLPEALDIPYGFVGRLLTGCMVLSITSFQKYKFLERKGGDSGPLSWRTRTGPIENTKVSK